MKYMTAAEIRDTWLRFFESKKHKIEASASLVPQNDPTLLWINAGVAPLKKYFDGSEKPSNPRLTNVQKCIRTNDIERLRDTIHFLKCLEISQLAITSKKKRLNGDWKF